MRKNKTYSKIDNLTGVISLLIIPVLFVGIFQKEIDNQNQNFLKLYLPPKDSFEMFTEYNYREKIEYKTMDLPVHFTIEQEIYLKAAVLKLQEENIQKTGLKFQLTDNHTYNDLVRLLNLMEITEQPQYFWHLEDNYFYVVNNFSN